MSTTQKKLDEEFIRDLSESRDEPDWLRKRRLKAWESYEDLPDPRVILTPGKRWTDISELDIRALSRETDDHEARTDIRVEGDVPDDVVLMDMDDALVEHEDLIRENLMTRAVRWDENRFTAVHAATWTSGVFVYVPQGVEVENVIRTVTDVKEESRFNHTLVIAEPNSKINMTERIEGGDESYFSSVVEIIANQGAEVNYGALQNLSKDSYQFTVKRGIAERDAEVNWIDGCFGTKLSKSVVSTVIAGEGASTNNYGAFFGNDQQHFDLETWTRHDAPHTTCDMFTRGVVDDSAVSAYEGTIKVTQPAFDVDAYQTENVLIVSDNAEADASPRLEIDNNDVKCSHAATVGQIDEEELFYMKTRGLDEEQARNRIIEGFFEPLFGNLPLPELEDDFRGLIKEKM